MKLLPRIVNGAIRLDMQAETATEIEQLTTFFKAAGGESILDMPARVESVGYTPAGDVDSIALEIDPSVEDPS